MDPLTPARDVLRLSLWKGGLGARLATVLAGAMGWRERAEEPCRWDSQATPTASARREQTVASSGSRIGLTAYPPSLIPLPPASGDDPVGLLRVSLLGPFQLGDPPPLCTQLKSPTSNRGKGFGVLLTVRIFATGARHTA